MADIGVVAIGRNEGERLRRCLSSVGQECSLRVYVDSGSDDGSVRLARDMGWDVLELDSSLPFSAARGRNEGFQQLLRVKPGIEFVQFVDGDCELEAGWLERAARELGERDDVAIVAGRLQERHPDASIYSRLCAMEWNVPGGETEACGGSFMVRAEAFRQVGGFDPLVVAGEEPELCLRLRRAGWRILRVREHMATHDADMHRFSQWWTRSVRYGRALARGVGLHGTDTEHHCVRPLLSALIWGQLLPIAAATCAIASLWFPWASKALVLVALAYAVLGARIYLSRRRLDDLPRHAALYAVFCLLSKMPTSLGIASHWWQRQRTPSARASSGLAVRGEPSIKS